MKTLITADWHLSDNPRDAYRHGFVADALPNLLHQYNIYRLIVLGDLTEEKDRHSAWLVNTIAGYFSKLSQKHEVIVLCGNHDFVDREHPFYEFLGKLSGEIRWIDKPTLIDFSELGTCLFLPHTRDYRRDWRVYLDKGALEDADHVFTHNTFQGAFLDNGRKITEGIPTDIFGNGVFVFSGDIHTPQTIDKTTVTYVGAPYQIDFGDSYQPRVIVLDGNTLQSVSINGPRKLLLEVSTSSMDLSGCKTKDIIKARIHLQPGEYAKWAEIKEKFLAAAAKKNLNIYSAHPIKPQQQQSSKKREEVKQLSDEEILRAYGKHMKVDERTLEIGIKLI